jgi:hypothetical protein
METAMTVKHTKKLTKKAICAMWAGAGEVVGSPKDELYLVRFGMYFPIAPSGEVEVYDAKRDRYILCATRKELRSAQVLA